MRVLSILIIYLIVVLNTVNAQSIQAEFIPLEAITQVKEGDFLEATIRVWPIENADLSQFKKLEKTVIFNALYLAQITSLDSSQNNADVIELKGIFIVKSSKLDPLYTFNYSGSLIELRSSGLKVLELQDKNQDFYILDQSLNKSLLWIFILGIFIVLILIAIITIKDYVVGLRPGSLKKSKKKYDDLFRRADKRDDYENLYKERDVWMELLTTKAPAHYEFLKILNCHQFKKEWGKGEYEEVKSSFDIIRRSFEK